jgi:hypothetical protein
MSQVAQNLADIIGQPVAVDLVKQSLVRTAETFKDGEHQRIAFLGEIFQNTEVVANILLQKNWQVWAAPDGIEFVTSDNPLVTMLPIKDVFAPGFGFNFPQVLCAFPLNPNRCLVAGKDTDQSFAHVDGRTVELVNEIQIRCMFQNTYSKTKREQTQKTINELGGTTRFGENAFLMPGDFLPTMKAELARLIQARRDAAIRERI